MPYNKNSKRSFRGRRSRRPKLSFETRVLQAVRSKKEVKIASLNRGSSLNNSIDTSDLFDICPSIVQGTQEMQRVGNKINLLKVVVRGYFTKLTPTTQPDVNDANVLIRHQIIKQKNASWNLVGPGDEFANNVLLENGQPYTGNLFNHMTPLNKNMFTSKKTIRTTLNGQNPYVQSLPGPELATAGTDSVSSMIKPFSYTLRFGKQGKTLNYQTDGAQQPTDWDYFMINTAQRALDGNAPNVCQVSYTVNWYFTDA